MKWTQEINELHCDCTQIVVFIHFSFKIYLFIWKVVTVREKRERKREGERERVFPLLVHCPNDCTGWGWAEWNLGARKLGTRNSLQVSHMDGSGPGTWAFFFQAHWQGAGIGVKLEPEPTNFYTGCGCLDWKSKGPQILAQFWWDIFAGYFIFLKDLFYFILFVLTRERQRYRDRERLIFHPLV